MGLLNNRTRRLKKKHKEATNRLKQLMQDQITQILVMEERVDKLISESNTLGKRFEKAQVTISILLSQLAVLKEKEEAHMFTESLKAYWLDREEEPPEEYCHFERIVVWAENEALDGQYPVITVTKMHTGWYYHGVKIEFKYWMHPVSPIEMLKK